MKYRLNKLEPKTTNNFNINDLIIELDLPKIKDLSEYKIISNENIKIETNIINKKLKTKIGIDFPKYLETTITIPKNTIIKKPILITKELQEKIFPNKLSIICEESSSATIIIEYKSNNKAFNYTNESITMKKNSNLNITYYNNISSDSNNMISFEGIVGENAKLIHNLIDISGDLRVYNADIDVFDLSENYFNMIYLGKDQNIIDINYTFKNIGKNSINKLIVEGSLTDTSLKNFRGTIDFLKGSENSIGQEHENCVLLSDKCKSRSLPILLCAEDNVTGSHGESTGKVNKDKLFYLMSRGFSKKEAERFIVMANFQKIINLLPSKELQEKITEAISKKI